MPGEKCPKAWKDRRKGLIPRGFDISLSWNPALLVVAKNPGHPLEEFEECKRYIAKKGKNLFDTYLKWRKIFLDRIFASKNTSLKYHKNRNRYLRFILGHSKKLESYGEYSKRILDNEIAKADHESIMHSVSMTQLFKCSTRNEQERLTTDDVRTCFEKFFREEVRLICPRAILAFGNEVSKILERLDTEKNLPPMVTIRHPAYFYPKGSEVDRLRAIRKHLKRYLSG
jgi:hypothetical protein